MKDSGKSRSGGSNGSLDGASAADLEQGYSKLDTEGGKTLHDVEYEDIMPFDSPKGGFVGRPDGRER